MSKLLIKNIKQLVQVREGREPIRGKEMQELPTIENAFLFCVDGFIASFGAMADCPEEENVEVIDALDRLVLPCWCDSHTHIVFAGSRETEFVDRIKGLSYEEIARRGGGILNSAKRLQSATEEELLEGALQRVEEIIGWGTGAVEIKSGYGLSVDAELKMLRVIKQLKKQVSIPVKATFLGAHAVPSKYQNKRKEYIRLIKEEMLPIIADEKLADYIDVFCDRGFFTTEETIEICEAGAEFGLKAKIHANELGHTGGISAGVKVDALSVDHLEHVSDEDVERLRNSSTIPTLLPSTAFFLGIDYAPARKLIDAGLPVALASDYNPGSSPSGKVPFVISLACIKMKITPAEAINAATINSAIAMEMEDETGSIAVGKRANLIITKPVPSIDYLPYAFSSDWIEQVVINGKSRS